ncbi:phage integrase N-terminal SAM-like domain-containing protein [Candidatus Thiosymbion oneisti]|uniref:phage integrase N-terminal SAM-like domain-containing protein n=1 Tax=Candidatus Thiosymbion oneisti TaxID=589554 RepID=UPI000A774562|nr:phage integrase N-terminal SAM-like domain-containing protein [Candidatus Thiosymbion oneisti]
MGNTPSAGTQTKPRLLDQVRDKIRFKHYSIRTEEAYVGWIKRFILYISNNLYKRIYYFNTLNNLIMLHILRV